MLGPFACLICFYILYLLFLLNLEFLLITVTLLAAKAFFLEAYALRSGPRLTALKRKKIFSKDQKTDQAGALEVIKAM